MSRSPRLVLLPLLAAAAALSGCRNNCQQLCHTMADYAQDECNKEWTSDEIAQCRDDFDEVSDSQDAVCEDIADTLNEEWSCEEINAYFDKEGGGGDSEDDASAEESEG
jgi:hypothetical protein